MYDAVSQKVFQDFDVLQNFLIFENSKFEKLNINATFQIGRIISNVNFEILNLKNISKI